MNEWQWPGSARAAVSLGYDDGNPDNLDQAMPDLEAAGLHGSFYLHLARHDVQSRADDWRAAHQRGHEIGNHTWHHNGRVDLYGGIRHPWITKPLEEYTEAEMTDEINRAADWLDDHIGGDPDRSFTYPCCHVALGQPPDRNAYAAAVAARCRFARTGTVDNPKINDPGSVDLSLIQTVYFSKNTFKDFQAVIRQVLHDGGWACFGLHGVGGGSHVIERCVHQALIQELKGEPIWVAPVKTVAVWIEQHRSRDTRT